MLISTYRVFVNSYKKDKIMIETVEYADSSCIITDCKQRTFQRSSTINMSLYLGKDALHCFQPQKSYGFFKISPCSTGWLFYSVAILETY